MRCALHRLGYVWKRPRHVLMPDPLREEKHDILRLLSGLPRHSVLLVGDSRIQEYIESFYNRQRRHSRLGNVQPAVFAENFSRQLQAA